MRLSQIVHLISAVIFSHHHKSYTTCTLTLFYVWESHVYIEKLTSVPSIGSKHAQSGFYIA